MGDLARLLLVVDDGAIAGHLSGVVEEPARLRTVRTATLRSLYVAPHLRGQGFGGVLINEFLNWATDAGAEQVEVTAYASNENAIRYYIAHRFTPFELVLRRPAQINPVEDISPRDEQAANAENNAAFSADQ